MITGHSGGQDLVMRANEKYLVQNNEQAERARFMIETVKFLPKMSKDIKL